MSLGLIGFLIGLYVMPLVLVGWGHQLRRKSPRSQAAFWGAVVGHCIAGVLAVTWGMIPPESFTPEETGRLAAGMSLLLLPVAGAAIGLLRARGAAR